MGVVLEKSFQDAKAEHEVKVKADKDKKLKLDDFRPPIV